MAKSSGSDAKGGVMLLEESAMQCINSCVQVKDLQFYAKTGCEVHGTSCRASYEICHGYSNYTKFQKLQEKKLNATRALEAKKAQELEAAGKAKKEKEEREAKAAA